MRLGTEDLGLRTEDWGLGIAKAGVGLPLNPPQEGDLPTATGEQPNDVCRDKASFVSSCPCEAEVPFGRSMRCFFVRVVELGNVCCFRFRRLAKRNGGGLFGAVWSTMRR